MMVNGTNYAITESGTLISGKDMTTADAPALSAKVPLPPLK